MLKFLVPVAGDRFSIAPGQIVEMPDGDQAKWNDGERARELTPAELALVEAGDVEVRRLFLEPEDPAETVADTDLEPTGEAERLAAIRAATEQLDETHFTGSGKADLKALAEVLGWAPSAAERDAAMAPAAEA